MTNDTANRPAHDSANKLTDVDKLRRAQERFVRLCEQLQDEFESEKGKRRGSVTWLGQRFAVDQGYMSQLLARERFVGIDVIVRVTERMRLQEAFFWGDYPGDRHYRAFLRKAEEPPMRPELQDFLDRTQMMAADQRPTREEIEYLRAVQPLAGREVTADSYMHLFLWVRGGSTKKLPGKPTRKR